MSDYITTQGDMFDSIAHRVYGSEKLMHLIIDANPQYRNVVVFPANCILTIPQAPVRDVVTFPPWRSNANS